MLCSLKHHEVKTSVYMRFLILHLFSMILSSGFLLAQEETDEIKVTIKTDKQLPALKTLHDEVVTGYYSQNKTGITGSVSVVEPSILTSIPAGNVNNLLQGSTMYGSATVGPEDVTYPVPQRQIDLSNGRLIQNR